MTNLLNFRFYINKIKTLDLLLFIIYFLVLIIFSKTYNLPLGLMDDFKNINLVEQLKENPIITYLNWNNERIFERGMIQPFYLLQVYIQYVSYKYFGAASIYILNGLILFFIFKYFIGSLNLYGLNLSFTISSLIFLIYPFTYDLFMFPSLQEKYIFLIYSFALRLLDSNKTRSKILFFTIGLIAPLIKLQGAIFFISYFLIFLNLKNIKSLFLVLGSFFGIVAQGYVIFFLETDYFVFDSNVMKLLNNLLNIYNLFFISIILISFLILKPYSLKNLNEVIILGLILSSFGLIFIYSNWYIVGYLAASYAFFLSVFLNLILNYINIDLKFKLLLLISSVVASSVLFLTPRLERWSDLNYFYLDISNNTYGHIYSCSSESSVWLNEMQNKNTFQHINSIGEIQINNYFIMQDDYQCESFIENIDINCKLDNQLQMNFKKIKILRVNC